MLSTVTDSPLDPRLNAEGLRHKKCSYAFLYTLVAAFLLVPLLLVTGSCGGEPERGSACNYSLSTSSDGFNVRASPDSGTATMVAYTLTDAGDGHFLASGSSTGDTVDVPVNNYSNYVVTMTWYNASGSGSDTLRK